MADKGSAAISIKNVATGEFRQYRSGRRLEENMAALAELLESGISLTEAIERLEQHFEARRRDVRGRFLVR